jgi:hypothetical protein
VRQVTDCYTGATEYKADAMQAVHGQWGSCQNEPRILAKIYLLRPVRG